MTIPVHFSVELKKSKAKLQRLAAFVGVGTSYMVYYCVPDKRNCWTIAGSVYVRSAKLCDGLGTNCCVNLSYEEIYGDTF